MHVFNYCCVVCMHICVLCLCDVRFCVVFKMLEVFTCCVYVLYLFLSCGRSMSVC